MLLLVSQGRRGQSLLRPRCKDQRLATMTCVPSARRVYELSVPAPSAEQLRIDFFKRCGKIVCMSWCEILPTASSLFHPYRSSAPRFQYVMTSLVSRTKTVSCVRLRRLACSRRTSNDLRPLAIRLVMTNAVPRKVISCHEIQRLAQRYIYNEKRLSKEVVQT